MLGLRQKRIVKIDIPYFSQWESCELVNKIIDGTLSPTKDPRWRASGASTVEEYKLWSWSMCGMACLKMILKDTYTTEEYRLIDLGKECMRYGVYSIANNEVSGLVYKPFCMYMKEKFNLNGEVKKYLLISKIKKSIENGNYAIASVNWEIRNYPGGNITRKPGGHLVLVTGFNEKNKTITIHNPSGLFQKSQERHEIPEKEFKKYFAYRGIIIKKHNEKSQ